MLYSVKYSKWKIAIDKGGVIANLNCNQRISKLHLSKYQLE